MLAYLLIALLLLALAARPLGRLRAQRALAAAQRRDSFAELLAQAERERIQRQVEAEGDQLPWR